VFTARYGLDIYIYVIQVDISLYARLRITVVFFRSQNKRSVATYTSRYTACFPRNLPKLIKLKNFRPNAAIPTLSKFSHDAAHDPDNLARNLNFFPLLTNTQQST
jgi:hypothetical protein